MMRLIGAFTALFVLLAAAGQAAEVQVTFTLPPGFEDTAVSWSATPLDLPPDADVLSAMVMQPEAATGPWLVVLDPGEYLISAFSTVEVFELIAMVGAEPATQSYQVPVLSLETAVAYRCDEPGPCRIDDPGTAIGFDLPGGWAAELPFFADMGNGTQATDVSVVFYQDTGDEGGAVWFLNPVDWVEDEAGPCREVPAGLMCTFDESPAAEAGFAIIAPSLRLGAAPAP